MHRTAPILGIMALTLSSASPFCEVPASAPLDALLSSAQSAFGRGQYLRSRDCYTVALHRYWRDFDASASESLLQATAPQMQRLAEQTRSIQSQLAHIGGLSQADAEEAGDDGDAAGGTNLEPAHHIPGAHPAPPGSLLVGGSLGLRAAKTAGMLNMNQPRAALAASDKSTLQPQRAARGTVEPPSTPILRDSDLKQLSSLPRRQQVRALERIAHKRLGLLRHSGTDAGRAPGLAHSVEPVPMRRLPSETASDRDAGWA